MDPNPLRHDCTAVKPPFAFFGGHERDVDEHGRGFNGTYMRTRRQRRTPWRLSSTLVAGRDCGAPTKMRVGTRGGR